MPLSRCSHLVDIQDSSHMIWISIIFVLKFRDVRIWCQIQLNSFIFTAEECAVWTYVRHGNRLRTETWDPQPPTQPNPITGNKKIIRKRIMDGCSAFCPRAEKIWNSNRSEQNHGWDEWMLILAFALVWRRDLGDRAEISVVSEITLVDHGEQES